MEGKEYIFGQNLIKKYKIEWFVCIFLKILVVSIEYK